ncbi:MAG: hypothetical protein KAI53_03895 [Candidatus Aenigmarchaeota archaeon]|nr:hypothetical protein [Candidatus Aenigmarchaeota archaeon]
MQVKNNISKKQARFISVILVLLVVGMIPNYASAATALSQWHPISELFADTDLDMQGYKITNVSAPTASKDVVTKAYVDAAASGSGYLNLKEKSTYGFDASCNWVPGGYHKYFSGSTSLGLPTTNKNDYLFHGTAFCGYESHSYCDSSNLGAARTCHSIVAYGTQSGGAVGDHCYTVKCWNFW